MKAFTLKRWADTPVDKYLVLAIMTLSAVGIVAVYSAISFLADTKSDGDTELFLLRHLLRLALALVSMGMFSQISYRWLAKRAWIGLAASMVLLLAVDLFGITSGGAARWLFGFQPSDVARVALVLFVAASLARRQAVIKTFRQGFVPVFGSIGIVVGLIGFEDLSTAAVVLVAVVVMCFVGRTNVLHLAGVGLFGMALVYLMLLSSPQRAMRVESYLGMKIFPGTNAEQVFSSQDEGYQAEQAKIAFAVGGLTGVGPGKSIQRDFLPAPYNDFIFAIVAEEYGIIGSFALLAILLLFLLRGFLRIARHAPDPLGLFLAVGLVAMLVLYGFIHAGVASGLLPVTGLPLPFVSYGGTSMVANGIMVGILLNISRHVLGKTK